jgi:hypothetical protein
VTVDEWIQFIEKNPDCAQVYNKIN